VIAKIELKEAVTAFEAILAGASEAYRVAKRADFLAFAQSQPPEDQLASEVSMAVAGAA